MNWDCWEGVKGYEFSSSSTLVPRYSSKEKRSMSKPVKAAAEGGSSTRMSTPSKPPPDEKKEEGKLGGIGIRRRRLLLVYEHCTQSAASPTNCFLPHCATGGLHQ